MHMQYEYIRFCGFTELTKVHDEYIKRLPNVIKILEILFDNGSKIGLNYFRCLADDNIIQYVRKYEYIPEYEYILHIVIKNGAKREYLNMKNRSMELRFIIPRNFLAES